MAARILKGERISLPETSILQEIIDSCKRHGDRVYLEDARTKRQSTFRQVLDNAGAISSTLRNLGQGPGKVVMILSNTSVEALTTNFGIWLSGAASLCLNPNIPTEEHFDKVKEVVSHLDWSVTIICPNRQDGSIDYYRCLEEGNSAEGILMEGRWTGKDHTLGVFSTSGTTGVPNGVILGEGTFKLFNANMKGHWTDSSILLLQSPMYWVSNATLLIITAQGGSKIVIASRLSIKELMETITEYKRDSSSQDRIDSAVAAKEHSSVHLCLGLAYSPDLNPLDYGIRSELEGMPCHRAYPNVESLKQSLTTHWLTGPAILIDLCKEDNLAAYDFSSFKNFYLGGYALSPQQRKMITEKMTGNRHIIRHVYGSTETGIVTYDRTIPDINSDKLGSIGKVANGVEIKVVDTETGKMQPPYAVGEICVKSPGLMKRYFNKERIENVDDDGFWHTGDLGYYDDDEYFFYNSRISDVMKYKGYQFAPAELEKILQKHPGVLESCVVGKTCIGEGELPAAFIVKKPGSNVTEQELHSYLSGKIIDEKKLRGGIFFVENLPKNPTGKVQRNKLKEMLG
ncbi:unnamed protein product [Nezara viridula]|uniref:Luciferin 4-monooxygenase-like n=1 Tax=Nezara viridula TaxID=85310 RepID=A0A9P0H6R6_NEZVI|nr:unnamed protein product [Nezara viridula]